MKNHAKHVYTCTKCNQQASVHMQLLLLGVCLRLDKQHQRTVLISSMQSPQLRCSPLEFLMEITKTQTPKPTRTTLWNDIRKKISFHHQHCKTSHHRAYKKFSSVQLCLHSILCSLSHLFLGIFQLRLLLLDTDDKHLSHVFFFLLHFRHVLLLLLLVRFLQTTHTAEPCVVLTIQWLMPQWQSC